MKKFDKIERVIQQYPLHQFWFDDDKLDNDIQRFKAFKSEVISNLDLRNANRANSVKIRFAINLLNRLRFKLSYNIECLYPSRRHPRLISFDQHGEINEYKHPNAEKLSYFSLIGLLNQPEEKFFPQYFTLISKTYMSNLQSCIEQVAGDRQKTICFITRRCFFTVKKIAKELRGRGYVCVLITIEDLINQDDYKDSFDIIIGGVDNYLFLSHVINSMNIDLFYIQCMMWDYGLVRVVNANQNSAKLACEFYDITGIYAPKDKLKLLWSSNQVDADLHYEDFIFETADLVLSRFDQGIIDEYRQKTVLKHVEIQPTISRDRVIKKVRFEIISTPSRLVYLGNLIPRNENHPQSLFPLWGMPEAWQLLLAQKFEIHVYNSPFRKLNEPGMETIIDLSKKFSNLHFHEGLPHEEIIDEITQYDFGINLSVVDFAKNQNADLLWRGAMGTKIFTYLEGGLPVLVNKEFESMSSFIHGRNLGCPISSTDIGSISKIIKRVDYKKMRDNVAQFNQQNTFERFNSVALNGIEKLIT